MEAILIEIATYIVNIVASIFIEYIEAYIAEGFYVFYA